jgi:hypothetical protein
MTMKTIVSAIVALSVLAGSVGTASEATDWTKECGAQHERNQQLSA